MKYPQLALATAIPVLLIVHVLAWSPSACGQATQPFPESTDTETAIHIARSQNGLDFRDTGQVLASNASCPTVVRLA